MYSLYIVLSLITFSHSATIVPLQSSHIDVRQSGAEFSYNIQENHGIATIGDHVPFASPIIKAVHIEEQSSDQYVKSKLEEHHQEQIKKDPKAEARATLDFKELKKPEGIITQPLLLSPHENYAYYYPYLAYSIPALPKTSFISYISTSQGIPYPYTLLKTA